MDYRISAHRQDGHGSIAMAKTAELTMDTDPAGRPDAFNPVELLLAALAACMIKGVERIAPRLTFAFDGIDVALQALRQDSPPKLVKITYQIAVTTTETDARLDLLHRNILKYGTISNTLLAAVPMEGTITRVQDCAAI